MLARGTLLLCSVGNTVDLMCSSVFLELEESSGRGSAKSALPL